MKIVSEYRINTLEQLLARLKCRMSDIFNNSRRFTQRELVRLSATNIALALEGV